MYEYSTQKPAQLEMIGSDRVFRFDIESVFSDNGNKFRYIEVKIPVMQWGYDALVSAIVRTKYTSDEIEAVVLNNNGAELDTLNDWQDHAHDIASKWFHVDQTIEGAKAKRLRELKRYDKSSAVNEFTFHGAPMWLDFAKRKDMRASIESLKAMGVSDWTYWHDVTPITLPVQTFEYILNVLEVYAIQCFNVTAQHKANISALDDVESIYAYDFTTGYPKKLEL